MQTNIINWLLWYKVMSEHSFQWLFQKYLMITTVTRRDYILINGCMFACILCNIHTYIICPIHNTYLHPKQNCTKSVWRSVVFSARVLCILGSKQNTHLIWCKYIRTWVNITVQLNFNLTLAHKNTCVFTSFLCGITEYFLSNQLLLAVWHAHECISFE